MRPLATLASVLALAACDDGTDARTLACTEFQDNEITGAIGGGAESRVELQALADYIEVANTLLHDVSDACARLATDLGVSADEVQRGVERDPADRVGALCALASDAIAARRRGEPLAIAVTPAPCITTAAIRTQCVTTCVHLPTCTVACDADARATALCPVPAFVVTFDGDPNAKATLAENVGPLLAADARARLLNDVSAPVQDMASTITDIKAACIPVVVAATRLAVEKLGATVAATAKVKTAAGVP